MLIAYFAIFLVIFVLLNLLIYNIKSRSKYMAGIPGPQPIFPVGNTLDFIAGSTGFLGVLMKYLNKYGESVVIYDGAFSKLLCTTDQKFLEFLYTSTEHMNKAKQYVYFDKWLGKGLLTSQDSYWQAHRKAITPSFHFSQLQDFINVFERLGNTLVKKLQEEAGNSVEISKIVSMYSLDVICECSLGVRINALENTNSDYIKNVKAELNITVSRAFSPINKIFYPLTWNCYREKKVVGQINKFVDAVINEKIKERERKELSGENAIVANTDENGIKKRVAFLDALLKVQINDQSLSVKEIRDEVNTLMFAGHDTVSSAISFCLLMLATHPEVQEQVFQEQLEIFDIDLKSVRPSYIQLNKMKYLELVIKESLRLYPPVPFFGRQIAKDTNINGILYPKGLTVMLFPYGVHRNPKYYQEPEKFIPERFKTQSGKLPYSYIPFSAGSRNCIGQRFAMSELLYTLSKLVRNFELGLAKPEHKMRLAAETVLISKNGIRISITNRIEKETKHGFQKQNLSTL